MLDAAARVFAEHGYAHGTTNRIAEEAGASVGSLYQYFPNKDAILVALARRHVADGAERVTAALAETAQSSLVDQLAAVVDAMLEVHADDARLHQVLFEEAPRPAELLAELHELEASITDIVEAKIRSDRSVQAADPAMAARLLVAAVESLVHRYVAGHHDALDLESFRHELLTMLSRYLGQPPSIGRRSRTTTGISRSPADRS